ncbi:hypothetical protein LAZ67_20001154, partial [Cordylochernes scorpioides]
MYLQRNISIQLDTVRTKKHLQNTNIKIPSRQLSMGDRVQAHLHYKVKLDDGYILKRHINQLRKTECPT